MKRSLSLWCAAVVMCVLVAPCLWAQSDQPSLADVARQKSATKAKRVVTNDEIPPSPEANLVAASGTAAAGGSGKAGAAPAAKKDAAKFDLPADKQTKMQELMKENDSLQKIIKQMQDKVDATNDPGRISTLSEVVKHAKEALAENQSEIDKLKAGGAATTQPGASPPANAPQAPPK
jgi:cell division protein FtsB